MTIRRNYLFSTLVVVAICMVAVVAHAGALSPLRDTLGTSAPGASASQIILFTTTQAIPAGGRIVIDFAGGGFTVPTAGAGFTLADLDLGYRATSTDSFTPRALSTIQSPATDRVTITSGASGSIRFDLATFSGIPAGYEVEVRIGTVAASPSDTNMVLSATPGSYPVTITTYTAAGATQLDHGQTRVVVLEQVTVGPLDTTDQIPPSILDAQPTGIIQHGTVAVQLYVRTDEGAYCRYATSSMAYAVMPYYFTSTTTGYSLYHFANVSGLVDGETYLYYVRCRDYRYNEIDPDYELTFTVGIPPGSATSTATSTGSTGTGTGTSTASSTGTSDMGGTDTGTGTGGSGSGSGSSPSGGDGAGSGSGGGGGGDGEGTQLPQASVRIEGYAYPNATVMFVRDGVIDAEKSADGAGAFSNLTEGLDRGSYSFGVYAVDRNGVRSATYATTLWLQSDTLSALSNIMLPPTVAVAENSIQPGDTLAVSGYSAPNASITTWLRPKLAQVSSADIVSTTTAESSGAWALTIATEGLSQGTYELVAQGSMADGTIESDKSARKTIGIGVEVGDDGCLSIGDLNCDGFVNLVDFSILLFNWNTASAVADINTDGSVSLPDFSIMLYNWTG